MNEESRIDNDDAWQQELQQLDRPVQIEPANVVASLLRRRDQGQRIGWFRMTSVIVAGALLVASALLVPGYLRQSPGAFVGRSLVPAAIDQVAPKPFSTSSEAILAAELESVMAETLEHMEAEKDVLIQELEQLALRKQRQQISQLRAKASLKVTDQIEFVKAF